MSKRDLSNVLPFPVQSRGARGDLLGSVVGLIGGARCRDSIQAPWRRVEAGLLVRRGLELITGPRSRLAVALSSGDVLQMKSESCCILVDVVVDAKARRIRVTGRFGGLVLFPGGDTRQAFKVDPFAHSAASAEVRPGPEGMPPDPPTRWQATDRCTDIVILPGAIEVRAVTLYRSLSD